MTPDQGALAVKCVLSNYWKHAVYRSVFHAEHGALEANIESTNVKKKIIIIMITRAKETIHKQKDIAQKGYVM